MANVLHRRKAFRGGGGTTVYVEQDFTLNTTGDLSTVDPQTDELGNGWEAGFNIADFGFQGDSSGVAAETTGGNRSAVVETDGREDVQVTLTLVISRGGADGEWQSMIVRHTGGGTISSLMLAFNGPASDPDVRLIDGRFQDTVLNTWDLSVLMTTPPDEGDTVELVARCSGDDITLYSISVNGASAEVIDDTYTLTGSAATAHGAGSGADRYGIGANDRENPGTGRFEYFKVESIPT